MKVIKREKPSVTTEYVYVADDGTEFSERSECESYEFKQEVNKRNIPHKKATDLEGYGCILWYIKSQEEFDWLIKTAWLHTKVYGKFSGSGWYLAAFRDGGDYWDSTDVSRLDKYIESYEKDIAELRRLTSNEEDIN